MRRRTVVVAASVCAAFAAVLVLASQRSPSAEIEVHRDLVYAAAAGADLKLDLALPKAAKGPLPTVVFLHGEGWRAGRRQQMNHFIEGMARLGYVGVTPDYRLVPGARFVALPNEGHVSAIGSPVFRAAVAEFLAGTTAAPRG